MDKVQTIDIKHILPDPNQPRQEFDPAALERLEKSIAKQGILVPLAVEKIPKSNEFLLLDGERRYRAAMSLKLKTVPIIVYEAMDARARIITRFHLQEQHSNWSAFDKARAIATMQQENEISRQEISDLLGLSRKIIDDYILLLSLSKRSVAFANEYKLPYTYLSNTAYLLRQVEDKELRRKMEMSILERVRDKTIIRANDINKFALAIKEGGKKVIEKIISSPEATVNDILEFAGLHAKVEHKRVMHTVSYLSNILTKGTKTKANQEMTNADESNLRALIEEIENYLTTAGAGN